MATYRYNVVVEVSIETEKMNAGNRAQKETLRSMENDVIESQRRINKEIDDSLNLRQQKERQFSEWNSQEAGRRRQNAIDDYHQQVADYEAGIDQKIKAMLNEQAQINAGHQQTAENLKTINRQSVADAMDAAKNRVQAKSYEASEVEKLNDRIRRSDPFQVTGRNQTASQTGATLRNNDSYQKYLSDIQRLDPFQNTKNTGLKDVVNDIDKFNAKLGENSQTLGMWGQAFKGAFIGAVAGIVFSTIIGGFIGIAESMGNVVSQSVRMTAELEQTRNSIAVFAGSAGAADREIRDLEETVSNTRGLSLPSAEEGYRNLRALGFQAEESRKLIQGLAKESLLSGADETATQRVIVNLTQLSAGSSRASQDIKEIIHAMPSLRKEFKEAFGTIDPKKIGQLFSEDASGAVAKLTAQLEKAKQAQGGLNTSVVDFQNELTLAGQELGREIVPELTKGLRDLTSLIKDNKAAAGEFGHALADGLRQSVSGIEEVYSYFKAVSDILDKLAKNNGNTPEQQKEAYRFAVPTQYVPREDLDTPTNPAIKAVKNATKQVEVYSDQQKELEALRINAEQKELDFTERARKEALEYTDQYFQKEQAIADQYYAIEDANLRSHLDLTLNEQLETLKKVGANKVAQLETQKNNQIQVYAAEVGLAEGNKAEIAKIEIKYNKIFANIDKEIQTARINTQAEVARKNYEILVQERETKKQFLKLEIDDLKFNYDQRTFEIDKAIEYGIVSTEHGYQELLDASNQYFSDLREKTQQDYALRLQDERLTSDQKKNLQKEEALEIAKIDDESYRHTLEIEDAKRDAIIKNLTYQRDKTRQTYEYLSGLASQFQKDFFNPETFSSQSLNNFKNFVLKDSQRTDLQNRIQFSDSAALTARKMKDDADAKLPDGTDLTTRANAVEKYVGLVALAEQRSSDLRNQLIKLDESIPDNYRKFAKLAEQVGVSADAFDKLDEAILEHRQMLDTNDAQSEIDYWQSVIDATKNQDEIRSASLKKEQAENRKKRLEYDQNIEKADQYRHSLEGINKEISLLLANDPKKIGGLKDVFDKKTGEETISVLEQIKNLEFEIASPDINAQYRIRAEVLQHIVDLRNEETEAIARTQKAQIDINRQMVYSKARADADLAEFFAKQKGITEILSDARVNALTAAYDGLDKVAASLAKNFGFAKDMVQQFISGLLKLAANQIFMKLFGASMPGMGGNGPGGTPNFNPNASGGGFNWDSLMNIFGGGGSGNGGGAVGSGWGGGMGNPNIFSNNANGGGIDTGTIIGGAGTDGGIGSTHTHPGGGSVSKGALAGMGINLAAMAAMVIGQKIGGIGGSALQWGGAGAMIGMQFGGPIGAAIGAGVGAIGGLIAGIFGRSSLRKKEEKVRNQAMIDALGGLDKLIEQVNNDQIDGAQAIEQADAIRQTYVDNMSALTDKKTRNIALADVSRLDTKIEALKMAVSSQTARRQRLELYAPTFADGGELSGFARNNYRNNPLGYQRGGQKLGYFPASKQYAIYNERGSEYIFDAETTRNVGVDRLDLIRKTKGQALNSMLFKWSSVQQKADGGAMVPAMVTAPAPAEMSSGQPIQVHIHVDGTPFGQAIAQALTVAIQSNDGSAKQMTAISTGLENQGSNKLVEQLAEMVKEKLGIT